MKKQLLLAAAAVTALVAAGGAQAASVSYRAGAAAASVDATATPYVLAKELNFAAGITAPVGQFDTIVVANTAGGIPPGTYTVQFDFTGATINAQVPNATITQTTAAADVNIAGEAGIVTGSASSGTTLTLVSGGSVGSTTATYTLQVPAGASVQAIGFSPALRVTGAVGVTAAIRNQVGNTFFEPAVVQQLIRVSAADSFAVTINGIVGAGAGTDTRIDEGTAGNPFNTLSGDAQVGTVAVAATAGVFSDLNGTTLSVANNVTSAAILVGGNTAGLTFSATNAVPAALAAGAIVNSTPAGTGATITAPGGANASLTTVSIAPTDTTPTAAQLNPTDLPVRVQLALSAGFTVPAAVPGSFETIQTDGIGYIVPWVTSNSFGQITGSTSVIRVSNIGGAFAGGRVYGQLYNPTNIGGVVTTSRSFNFGTIGNGPANSELVIGSVELQNAFGDFGRGDLRLTVTDTQPEAVQTDNNNTLASFSNSIVVKRVIRSANGSLTEMLVLSGDASAAQNQPNDQGVPY